MAPIFSQLLESSLQPSSLLTYRRAWKLFHQFLHIALPVFFHCFPISPSILALFVAYLYNHNYAPSTVNTYISALGYCHKLSRFPDPTKVFFAIQMLKGYGKIGFRLDSRLPITLPILHRLLEFVAPFCRTPYEVSLFRPMYSVAFFPGLRVGEITSSNSKRVGLPCSFINLHSSMKQGRLFHLSALSWISSTITISAPFL